MTQISESLSLSAQTHLHYSNWSAGLIIVSGGNYDKGYWDKVDNVPKDKSLQFDPDYMNGRKKAKQDTKELNFLARR